MGVASYHTRVKLGGTSTAFTGEAASYVETDADTGYFIYQLDSSWKRVLDRSVDITVYDDAAEVADADIAAINYLFGLISFSGTVGTDGTDATITVDGSYIPVSEGEDDPDDPGTPLADTRLAYCNSYDLAVEASILDKTGFKEAQSSQGARVRESGIFDANVSLGGFGHVSQPLTDAFYSRTPVLVEIIPGNGAETFRGWFVVDTDSLSGGVDDLETADISMQLDDSFTGRGYAVNMGWSDLV